MVSRLGLYPSQIYNHVLAAANQVLDFPMGVTCLPSVAEINALSNLYGITPQTHEWTRNKWSEDGIKWGYPIYVRGKLHSVVRDTDYITNDGLLKVIGFKLVGRMG